jgi:two-component system, chemotaxis family, chemotaxis protein CheY
MTASGGAGAPRHILVVDDDADLRETLQLLLDDSGYGVTAVAGGRAALDRLHAGARPSLILLDLMMPDMNGWQFLEQARADPDLRLIPVVVMTAHKAADLAPLPSGHVLHKPFDSAKLLRTIARFATVTS